MRFIKRFFKRIIGLIITLVSILGMIVGIAGAVYVRQGVTIAQNQAANLVGGTIGAIDSAELTIGTIRDTIAESSNALVTVEQSAINVAFTITSTEPALDQVASVMGNDVAATVETLQTAIPSLVEVAGALDDALRTLDDFSTGGQIDFPPISLPIGPAIQIPSVQLPQFGLGIEYNPETSLDASLVGIEDDLEGVPESMRLLGLQLEETGANIVVLGSDVTAISRDINAINSQVSLLPGQLDDYVASLELVRVSLDGSVPQIRQQLEYVGWGLTVLLVWFALIQIAPLYIGSALLFGRKID